MDWLTEKFQAYLLMRDRLLGESQQLRTRLEAGTGVPMLPGARLSYSPCCNRPGSVKHINLKCQIVDVESALSCFQSVLMGYSMSSKYPQANSM